MAMKTTGSDAYPLYSAVPETYELILRAETASSADPDGADPALGTWAWSTTGTLTYTFDAGSQPRRVLHADCTIEETGIHQLKFISYTSSTRVALFHFIGSSGARADYDDYTMSVKLVCTKATINDA